MIRDKLVGGIYFLGNGGCIMYFNWIKLLLNFMVTFFKHRIRKNRTNIENDLLT